MSEVRRPIRILIVDDHGVMRAGLRMLVASRSGFQVVGEAATGGEALSLAEAARPDLILLDLDLGTESGLSWIAVLKAKVPGVRILVLTGLRDRDTLDEAVRRGAAGVVAKERAAETLLEAIATVADTGSWKDPTTTRGPRDAERPVTEEQSRAARRRIATLTRRELEVVELVLRGKANREIADALHISETTVRHHLTTIYEKLEVPNRVQLILFLQRHPFDSIRADFDPPASAH